VGLGASCAGAGSRAQASKLANSEQLSLLIGRGGSARPGLCAVRRLQRGACLRDNCVPADGINHKLHFLQVDSTASILNFTSRVGDNVDSTHISP